METLLEGLALRDGDSCCDGNDEEDEDKIYPNMSSILDIHFDKPTRYITIALSV